MMTSKIPPMSLITKAFLSRGTPMMLLEVIVSYTRKYCQLSENQRVIDVINVMAIFRSF